MIRRPYPATAALPAERSLRRLRWLLTGWFTLALVLGVAILVVLTAGIAVDPASRVGDADRLAAGILAALGAILVSLFALAAWVLLGYLLTPVTRSLAAQESFLAAAAHDLRTPLATLSVLLETARKEPTRTVEVLERSTRLVDRTGGIANDLLLRARLAAGTWPVRPRPTRLDQLVEGVLTDLAGADGQLDATTRPDGSYTVALTVDGHQLTMVAAQTVAFVDPDLAGRAVANLVHNALRHGHEPGKPATITITVDSDGGNARATVTDTGPGLRLPLPQTGLGLSLVRWTALAHRGALELDAAATVGTKIRLIVPTADSASTANSIK